MAVACIQVPLCELLLVLEGDQVKQQPGAQSARNPNEESWFESPVACRLEQHEGNSASTWSQSAAGSGTHQEDRSSINGTSNEMHDESLARGGTDYDSSFPCCEERWKADIGSSRFQNALRAFLETWFGTDKLDKLLSNPHIPPEQVQCWNKL
jgi:hypothetical protein